MQQVAYGYTADGLLASITYPDGSVLGYVYDATGRLTQLNWNGPPLVTGIAWNPLGQPTAWTWAFASSEPERQPQLRHRGPADGHGVQQLRLRRRRAHHQPDAAAATARRTATPPTAPSPAPGELDAWATTRWAASPASTPRARHGLRPNFGYDPNGNRMHSLRSANGQSTTRAYQVGYDERQLREQHARARQPGVPTHEHLHRWLRGGIRTQSISTSASNTSVTYGYNANGDLLSDGLRSYTYDAEGRWAVTTGATETSPTTRYAHNALGPARLQDRAAVPAQPGRRGRPGLHASLIAFFTKLWSPSTTQAEQLGYAYVYDEQGTLIAEVGSGGTNSAGQAQYIYLPTANGPMPIAAVINGATYAVHSDHLNTPRKLTNASGQAVWQWSYSCVRGRQADAGEEPVCESGGDAEPGHDGDLGGEVQPEVSGAVCG